MNSLTPKTYEAAKEAATRRTARRLARQKGEPRYGLSQKVRKPLGFSGRLGAGRKTKAWSAERRKLKADSERNSRTTCELRGVIPHECTYDDFLGYAHDAKRRKLTREDLKRAILVCNNVHDLLEVMKPEEMKRIVNDTIAARQEAA